MATFRIYADDSGKFETQNCEYTSLCGYVGHAAEWERFCIEWNSCRLRWQVPPIHMRRIRFPHEAPEWQAVKEKWAGTWDEKKDDMLQEFAHIVQNASIACVGAVVDATHYRSIAPAPLKESYKDSLSLAFHQLVMRGIEKTETVDSHASISIVIDDDRDSAMCCHEMLTVLKGAFSKVRERIVGISYVNDKAYPPVQAADMIAYESRRLMTEKITDVTSPTASLYAALTFRCQHQPKFYSAEVLDRLQANAEAREKDK
jgi:hypothetical protein